MLFRRAILEAVARGDVTLAFRRRQRPTVKAGLGLRTAAGVVRIGAAEPIDEQDVGELSSARKRGEGGWPQHRSLSSLASRASNSSRHLATRNPGTAVA